MDKAQRQKLIQRVIQESEVGTQRELVEALRAMGCKVTQATVSRDIRELALQKVRTRLGYSRYVLDARDQVEDPVEAARRVMRNFVNSISVVENLIVVRCELGSAAAVSQRIDNLSHADVLGTIAGDDTLLMVVESAARAPSLKRFLDRLCDG